MRDPELLAHQQWLGYLQPVGLVVSAPALLQCQAHVNTDVATEHQRFLDRVSETLLMGQAAPVQAVKDLRGLLIEVFGWQLSDLVDAADPKAVGLEVVLENYHETLRPTCAVPEDARAATPRWLLLIQELPTATRLDEVDRSDSRHWQATPHDRFVRLLHETQVPIGLLFNETNIRLIYAPRGETPGLITFPVRAMTEVAGRPIFAALLMLLSAERLFSLPDKQRLSNILVESRKYQNTVSTELAQQVLAALFELLRGFQAADDLSKSELLRDVLASDPDQVYAGLLTVLLRLVFLLYAEDRGLMSEDAVYVNYYSVTGLFERLRIDDGHHPDTMDLRYGGWAQLLTLFRLVHDGGRQGRFHLPARHGYLFNPDRYPFLEGRNSSQLSVVSSQLTEKEGKASSLRTDDRQLRTIPLVSDGVLFRVLNKLMILGGERISYSHLDVEHIGSVYEGIMGFRLEQARGASIAVRPAKAHGAPVTISLEALLSVPAKDRGKWLKEQTDQSATGAALNALKAASKPEDVVAALDRKIARDLTPNIVPAGSMVLQPSEERRRSGSHYTPRSLTGPIVRKALEPVLKQLGEQPTPKQLLDLKVCDPAMGSGAFLVESCRQLGEALLKAWATHGGMPRVPDDETPELFAQRTIAQRCVYGVDKNPMAVDLAKLSLWLATLAKEHPFTFLDHSLRCGDSLVGLTRKQIVAFHWKTATPKSMYGDPVAQRLKAATTVRCELLDLGDETPYANKQQKLDDADDKLNLVRLAGDLVVAGFFAAEKDKDRERKLALSWADLEGWLKTGDYLKYRQPLEEVRKALRGGEKGVRPFHWEIEFPEVFGHEDGGFDCIVGNPPFRGGTMISTAYGKSYLDFLNAVFPESGNRMDLVAYFFRRGFGLLRPAGTLGFIATNTIAQGDTREGGLTWICRHGGDIFSAQRRFRWPGEAAVVVSVIHVAKQLHPAVIELDGRTVKTITSFLFHAGGHQLPSALLANSGKHGNGSKIYGQGFLFADESPNCTPKAEMFRLIKADPRNQSRIFPYIGGEEVNDSPTHLHNRYVIDFGEMPLEQVQEWPDLFRIVEERVKPEREKASQEVRRCPWWQHFRSRPELYDALRQFKQVLVIARVGQHGVFCFLPTGMIYSEQLVVFTLESLASFSLLQSRVHEVWARFFSSSMKDDLRYTASDCFETFPFPNGFESHPQLEAAGKAYYDFRAALMVRTNEGLTKTYNRFHDPNQQNDPDIKQLHELHAAMDRAVLDAYGWTDLQPTCEFLLDYEEEEDEEESTGRQRKKQPTCEFLLDYEEEEDEEESTGRQRKKPWRYRWQDEFRDVVLARLLELNKQRAEQEALAGRPEKPKKGGRKKTSPPPEAPGLF